VERSPLGPCGQQSGRVMLEAEEGSAALGIFAQVEGVEPTNSASELALGHGCYAAGAVSALAARRTVGLLTAY
jgi:hypothetical protein